MLAHPIQSRGVPGAGSRHSASDGIAKPSIELIDGTAVKRFLVPAGPPEHWLVVGTPEPRESEPRGATATAARGGQPWLRAGTVVFRHISHRRPARRPSHRRGIQIFAPVAANLKRSEERRVGKKCSTRRAADHKKQTVNRTKKRAIAEAT